MVLKNDEKFEQELASHFKIDMSILTNFDVSTQKSQKYVLQQAPFQQKYIKFELKKYRGFIFHDTEHSVKSAHIRYPVPHFPAFGLNKERY